MKTGAEAKDFIIGWSGRGAFRTAKKVYREVFWSVRKRKCRHK